MFRFLKSHGSPTVHHVTFMVPSLLEARKKAESFGFDIVGYDDSSDWKEFFLHPKQAMGIVVQFAQSAETLEDEVINLIRNTQQKTSLLGIRLKSKDKSESLLLWKELLCGNCSESNGVMSFSWPDSSMKILVDLNSDSNTVDRVLLDSPLELNLSNGWEKIFEVSKHNEVFSKL